MLIKRYLVKNMNEAMIRIRYELGGDAVIVSSRKIKQRGIRNLFKPKILEVTAAVDRKEELKRNTDNKSNTVTVQANTQTGNLVPEQTTVLNSTTASKAEKESIESRLEIELKELKSLVGKLMEKTSENDKNDDESNKDKNINRNDNKPYMERVVEHLKTMEVDEEIINDYSSFYKESADTDAEPEKVLKYFKGIMPGSTSRQEMNERVWAFVGPTGVGKTTTIAKIAAQEMLSNNKTVGLITLDTYRIGAVEQLKTYAKILNIPLEVVFNKADLIDAMEKLRDCDLTLIDSTGRNSLDKEQLLETKDLLDTLENKRNFLVVNAGTRRSDLKAIIESYCFIGFDSIVLTKLDETKYYGNILNIGKLSDKPLCFVTTGQVVPDDILEASEANLVDYVLMGVQS